MAKRMTLPYSLSPSVRAALDAGDVSGLLEAQRRIFGVATMTIPDPPVPPTPPGPPAPPPPAPPAPPTPPAETGFPANTPIVEMTPEQQAAYWKHQSRKHEDVVKGLGDVSELQRKAAAHDDLLKANQTDHEKALETARQEAADQARADERSKNAGELVKLTVKAALAGKGLKVEDYDGLVNGLDPTKYLAADGSVDTVKVAELVAPFTPGTGSNGRGPDTGGQGRRGDSVESTVKSGRDRYAERHGNKQQQSATA